MKIQKKESPTKQKISLPITGGAAAAHAFRQINPDVMSVYPITPQTPIIQTFAQFKADGMVDTEIIRVESEHSAMAGTIGASAAGARAVTATASVGLALMFEVVGAASGMRLPIVMQIANRALSSPINIHCDHSDSMAARDLSWIQIYSDSCQEVYEHTFLATRLAEKIMLPVMVMQDGFLISHSVEKVNLLSDKEVQDFVGEYKPKHALLDTDNPVTMGSFALQNSYFELKRQQADTMNKALKEYLLIGKELSKLTGNKYEYFESYKLKDAEQAIVAIGTTAGTTKTVVDELRKQGKKVGLLKIKLFRPFPYAEVRKALEHVKVIGILDRSESFGANAPLYSEIKNALYSSEKRPAIQSYVYGLGGKDIFASNIKTVYQEIIDEKLSEQPKYIMGQNKCTF